MKALNGKHGFFLLLFFCNLRKMSEEKQEKKENASNEHINLKVVGNVSFIYTLSTYHQLFYHFPIGQQ